MKIFIKNEKIQFTLFCIVKNQQIIRLINNKIKMFFGLDFGGRKITLTKSDGKINKLVENQYSEKSTQYNISKFIK